MVSGTLPRDEEYLIVGCPRCGHTASAVAYESDIDPRYSKVFPAALAAFYGPQPEGPLPLTLTPILFGTPGCYWYGVEVPVRVGGGVCSTEPEARAAWNRLVTGGAK
jgi:hypothetical protein